MQTGLSGIQISAPRPTGIGSSTAVLSRSHPEITYCDYSTSRVSLGTSGHYTIYDYTEHKPKNRKKRGGGWERGYHYSENSMRALLQCKIQWNLKFHISQLWSRFFKDTVRLYACSIMICRRLETAQRPIQYLRPSLVPRPRPAFHHLQYGKAGEGLV